MISADADGVLVRLWGNNVIFRRVDGHLEPTWPGAAQPMQAHLDFYVDDMSAATTHLIELGARRAEHQPHDESSLTVMIDPAGRPFCIGLRPA